MNLGQYPEWKYVAIGDRLRYTYIYIPGAFSGPGAQRVSRHSEGGTVIVHLPRGARWGGHPPPRIRSTPRSVTSVRVGRCSTSGRRGNYGRARSNLRVSRSSSTFALLPPPTRHRHVVSQTLRSFCVTSSRCGRGGVAPAPRLIEGSRFLSRPNLKISPRGSYDYTARARRTKYRRVAFIPVRLRRRLMTLMSIRYSCMDFV